MEKNQKGEPTVRAAEPRKDESQRQNGASRGELSQGMSGCNGTEGAPLGYATFPIQSFRLLYSAPDALKNGTLFEELNLPKGVYKNG